MQKELAKVYEPKEVESRLYKFWLDNKYFHAEVEPDKKPYTIVMPPPNITGKLHEGHALDHTLQDTLIRWRRMQGYNTLWLPGTDHASIATEAKIVEAMAKEGVTKDDIGRDGFLERAWAWKETYGNKIVEQLMRMGSSCDWDRERFTMDEGCSEAVKEVFVRLYEKGLIYQGERIINWCPHCLTSISDAEVEYEEKDGSFWHIRYPLTDGSGYVELATTRPETMLGDTAIAVNPDDERYKDIVGKTVMLPIVNREIPVIADSYVEMDFGTGVVKITPAHDPNDFEVGLRHDLPIICVTTDDNHMNENAGEFEGMTAAECRKVLVKKLDEEGFLIKVEPLKHNVGSCYRCHTTVEPRISKQWFVKMEPLAEPAVDIVKNGTVKFVPERFDKTYFNWMENIKDWCISRQLWWGHRIPAWYCKDCGEVMVLRDEPTECSKCHSKNIEQDPDALDTWFSSALWPFSTLGWPNETEELKHFYPTNTLVTGYDIIFFWVARMVFSAIEHTGKEPFQTVLIHGLVRDELGRKMSKSLGNGNDVLQLIDDYGADALRFTFLTGNSPGNDMRFSENKLKSSRNFANKIWNATRFILMNLKGDEKAPHIPENLSLEDKWIISQYNTLIKDVTDNLEKFELGVAASKLYDFIWDVFCDWYIELAKIRLQKDNEEAETARAVLVYIMSNTLKLLHPMMPFITEEIWQSLPHDGDTIMLSQWPEYDEKLHFEEDESNMEKIMTAIKAIRNRRAEMNVPPSRKAKIYIETALEDVFAVSAEYMNKLASASEVEIGKDFNLENSVNIVTSDAKIYIPMGELIDFEAERKRLQKEMETAQKQLDMVMNKLNNEKFVSNAPQAVVDGQRAQAESLEAKLSMLRESLESLGK
ncbi:MAG: valine--tRNA ligase [Clostridia bacterium]|nr:valine--tRNA ligase [Clostridia bacterium]